MKFFITKCMCCGREKSRVERPDLSANKISHGICEPVCKEAAELGWGPYVGRPITEPAKVTQVIDYKNPVMS